MIVGLNWQPYLVLLGLLLITSALLMNLRKRARRAASRPSRRPQPRPGSQAERGVQRSMEQVLVELQGVSREINAQLDVKMRALTQLIEQADRQIERLERLLGEVQPGEAAGEPEKPAPAPVDRRHRRVYELADAGLSAIEIARQTGQPVGEVQLILSLRSAGASEKPDQPDRPGRGGQVDLRT